MKESIDQTEQLIEALLLVERHGTIAAAAKAAGVPRSTLSDRYKRAQEAGLNSPDQRLTETSHDPDYKTIRTIGPKVRTVEDALSLAEVDTAIWEVVKSRVNSWPTTMKVKQGDGTEQAVQVTNWQVSTEIRRKAPKFVQDAIERLVPEEWQSPFEPLGESVEADHLLVLSLYDVHLGKLCWAKETGADYDLDVTVEVFTKAVQNLLSRVSGFDIEQICFPIGNDFFQSNNWNSETARGTRVDSVDDRMSRVFEAALKMLVWAIEECRAIAPVRIVWVPGNHDPETSWYLVTALKCWFRDCADVVIDDGPSWRKYLQFGTTLIGMTHGNEEKHNNLPLIMATEKPEQWSSAKCREWHVGHLHTKREYRFTPVDEFGGVVVRLMPSLSGTDSWHYRKGYVGNNRAAEALLYNKELGYIGQFSESVQDG